MGDEDVDDPELVKIFKESSERARKEIEKDNNRQEVEMALRRWQPQAADDFLVKVHRLTCFTLHWEVEIIFDVRCTNGSLESIGGEILQYERPVRPYTDDFWVYICVKNESQNSETQAMHCFRKPHWVQHFPHKSLYGIFVPVSYLEIGIPILIVRYFWPGRFVTLSGTPRTLDFDFIHLKRSSEYFDRLVQND